MFEKFLNSLTSIIRLKMIPPTIVPGAVPKVSEHISSYCEKIAAMKKSDGVEQFKEWQVDVVTAYKCKEAERHEYIRFDVRSNRNQDLKEAELVIERTVGESSPILDLPGSDAHRDSCGSLKNLIENLALLASASNSSSSASLPSSSPSSSPSSPSCFADDRILPLAARKRNKADTRIYELHFTGKPLFLYQLAILALVVHRSNAEYILTTNNCYHFAGTIMKALQFDYLVPNMAEDADAGHWCGLDMFARKTGNNIAAVVDSFHEHLKNFVSFILGIKAALTHL
jgi:hypothetical protein